MGRILLGQVSAKAGKGEEVPWLASRKGREPEIRGGLRSSCGTGKLQLLGGGVSHPTVQET